MACPNCGSTDLKKTRNLNESACDYCGCEFKESDHGSQIYVAGDFDKFMESVVDEICSKISDASIITAMQESVKGFLYEGYKVLPEYMTHLTKEAETLYNQYQVGMREKEDFGAVLEGVEKIVSWIKLHEEDYPDFDLDLDDDLDDEGYDDESYDDLDDLDVLSTIGSDYDEVGGLDMDEDECGMSQPSLTGPGILGMGSMPQVGDLNTSGLPSSDDIAIDRAKDAAEEIINALDDIDASEESELEQDMIGVYESEDFTFSVGDSVYIGNNDKETYKIIAIHEGKVVAKNEFGQVTTVDLKDEFREVDIQFSRVEESAIVMERAEASAKNMRQLWENFERSQFEDEGVESNKVIRTTYETWTPRDIEIGDTDDRGWIDEEGEPVGSVEEAVDFLTNKNARDASSSHFHPGIWYTATEEGDNSITNYSFHLDGFTPEEEEQVFNSLKASGIVREDDSDSLEESVIGDHFHTPDGTQMPFPFTQDPTNSASEKHKEEKMEEETEETEEREEAAGLKAKEKIEESALNGLREGDIIHKGSDFSTQWKVTKITRGPARVHLKSDTKTTLMNPMKETFQYIDGVSLGYERNLEGIDDTRKIWESLEESFKSENTLMPISESAQMEPEFSDDDEVFSEKEVISKNELYSFVKEGDYHKLPRSSALQELVSKFGNSLEEMEAVLDDAVLSETDESINESYGVEELGELDTTFALQHAWDQMEEEIGLQKSADDQHNGEMGGNPRVSSDEKDVMNKIGSADDLRINFNEGRKWFSL